MGLLLFQGQQQRAAQAQRQLGVGQQHPGVKLYRLQLVVGKALQALRARHWIGQLRQPRQRRRTLANLQHTCARRRPGRRQRWQ